MKSGIYLSFPQNPHYALLKKFMIGFSSISPILKNDLSFFTGRLITEKDRKEQERTKKDRKGPKRTEKGWYLTEKSRFL